MSEEELRANPYVGLRPFFAEDSLYFYGRDPQIEELLAILRNHRFLGVVGSSGSGKSSLVRAGLLPGLLGGFLVQDRDRWRMAQVKPGDAPIGNLCAGLLEAMDIEVTAESHATFEQSVRDGHTGAAIEFLRTRLESNANLFLLVDQFEEIFAFRGQDEEEGTASADLRRRSERARRRAEATDFVHLLLSLAEQRDLPIYVALTMRTDFLGDCDLFHGLPEALNRGRYLVPRMTRAQLRDAVECPALLLGAQVAPRLLDHIINELGDRFDRLPVLQHALLRTWDEWERAGGIGPIDLQHFKSAGGLAGSLAQDAEAALAGLDVEVTARVFKRLTDTDLSQRRIRSPARVSELTAAANADRATIELILRRFEEDGRSFVHRSADGRPDDPRIDISHESLIRQWGRLRHWVDEERQSRDQYKELVTRASRYSRGDVALLQDPELQIAIDWRDGAAPSSGWARRYSDADDAFDSAQRYLDESLATRCLDLAEQELNSGWTKIWRRLLAVEFIAGLWLASDFGGRTLFGKDATVGALSAVEECAQREPKLGFLADGGRFFGEFVKNWDQMGNQQQAPDLGALEASMAKLPGLWDFFLSQGGSLVDLFWNRHFFVLVVFLVVCVYLNKYARRRYRSDRLPPILHAIESRGGRNPVTAEELPDARHAKAIAYATSFQRLRGWLIDVFRQGITAVIVFTVVFFLIGVVEGLLGTYSESEAYDVSESEAFDAQLIAVLAAIFVVNWWKSINPITSEQRATKGMLKAGIYRVDRYGRTLSYARATAWYFARYLSCIVYFLGFAIQPFMPKRQTFHDWVAGTVVLRVPARVAGTVVRRVQPRASGSAARRDPPLETKPAVPAGDPAGTQL